MRLLAMKVQGAVADVTVDALGEEREVREIQNMLDRAWPACRFLAVHKRDGTDSLHWERGKDRAWHDDVDFDRWPDVG